MSLFERMVVWADELPWGDPVFVIYATGAGSALLVAGGASFGGRSRRSAGVGACISATGTWALGLGLLGWTQAIAVGPDGPQGHGSIEVSPFDQIVVARFVAKTLAAVTLATMVPLYRAWGVRAAVTAMLLVSACGGTLHAMAEWDLQFSLWGMDGTVPPAGARWESAREAVVLMGSVVSAFVAVTSSRSNVAVTRGTVALAVLSLGGGLGVYFATRAHHHDARHPLPRHGLLETRPTTLHPVGAACEPVSGGVFHHEGLEEAAAVVERLRRWRSAHPAERLIYVEQPLDATAARVVGPGSIVLVTERRWEVATQTRGVLTLREACGVRQNGFEEAAP